MVSLSLCRESGFGTLDDVQKKYVLQEVKKTPIWKNQLGQFYLWQIYGTVFGQQQKNLGMEHLPQ